MKLLVVVADSKEVAPMKRLLAKAGLQGDIVRVFTGDVPEGKPAMKTLRAMKESLDRCVEECKYDYIIAAGETAARWVLDTSSVNINKLRGRDFEYAYGVKQVGKKGKNAVSEGK